MPAGVEKLRAIALGLHLARQFCTQPAHIRCTRGGPLGQHARNGPDVPCECALDALQRPGIDADGMLGSHVESQQRGRGSRIRARAQILAKSLVVRRTRRREGVEPMRRTQEIFEALEGSTFSTRNGRIRTCLWAARSTSRRT